MINSIKKLFVPVLILLALGFFLFLFNQVNGLYSLASELNPVFGKAVLALLVLVIGILIVSPFMIYFKLPKPIQRPRNEGEVKSYQKKVLERLKNNQILLQEGHLPNATEDLDAAIKTLNKKADEIIGETASIVFLTTSISQNGKLDAFTVFGTQLRMIWKVAHIYYQRPSLRELGYLYVNVGASSFLASEIEDLDITKQIEPVATAIFRNASGKSVPLIGPTAQILLDSLLEGSTNAFLTLRVGILAKKYCGELGYMDSSTMKREALKEAALQLKSITIKSSAKVISAILKATGNASLDTIKSGWEGIKQTGSKVKDEIVHTSQKMNPFKKRQRDKETND